MRLCHPFSMASRWISLPEGITQTISFQARGLGHSQSSPSLLRRPQGPGVRMPWNAMELHGDIAGYINGRSSGTDLLEVPTIFLGLCKGISPQNMAWNMVLTYLHFRILEFPLLQVSDICCSIFLEKFDGDHESVSEAWLSHQPQVHHFFVSHDKRDDP